MSTQHIGLTNGRSPDDVFPLEATIEALAQFIVQLPKHRREAEHDRRIDAIRKRLIDEGFPPEYAQACVRWLPTVRWPGGPIWKMRRNSVSRRHCGGELRVAFSVADRAIIPALGVDAAWPNKR